MMVINATGMNYRALNEKIRCLTGSGEGEIILEGINGQRYIADGIKAAALITIKGTPGNDLGAFMDGPGITVLGNCQDGTGNTMSGGSIAVHGDAGDIVGHSMRGGRIYIKGNAGYRVGIHMKSYENLDPVIIIGGSVQDFAGEYMAGGTLVVLGEGNPKPAGNYIGTGMHGGIIAVKGKVEDFQLGGEARKNGMDEQSWNRVFPLLNEYCGIFSLDARSFSRDMFTVLCPITHRPYGRMYAY
ncbi:hypothetical protein COS16_02715 [Candidatus Desantisbacteria bacterium CG02_land_8_20_14_3_00_49_13]|nr:MAG: hypothetical protein AUJ67_00185 [Candidatus Desantisbacteria bacterium CG1_02_49_89]PIV56800.1 MAG: hypothetical protein COS16_02715 [Candidatus Desantisbacteria bacterium CG02_land_8_20_14_3_00_49_13]